MIPRRNTRFVERAFCTCCQAAEGAFVFLAYRQDLYAHNKPPAYRLGWTLLAARTRHAIQNQRAVDPLLQHAKDKPSGSKKGGLVLY